MRRLFNFVMGFVIGVGLSLAIVMLATPQSGQTIRALFTEAYQKRKADLEAALDVKPLD